ncbi:MAG: Clp protease ClpP [Selenomonadaceae bacterium]|nr:Clp protease ClpP [Selenomonadaceae bacterium]
MKKFWQIKNEAESETAELLLYGEISDRSWWGDEITPQQFADDLRNLGGKALTVGINSPGGDVFAAQAIYNQLTAYPGAVSIRIDGMCASAATIVACAGGHVMMPANAVYMIHNPMSGLMGFYDEQEMEAMAAQLKTVKNTILEVYQARTGGTLSKTKLSHMMDNETWMGAQDAEKYGFVDEIVDISVKNSFQNGMFVANSVNCPLGRFKNIAALQAVLEGRSMKSMENNNTDLLQKIANRLGIGKAEEPQEPKNNQDAVKAAVQAERQRITDLDAMKNGNPAVDSIVETAKKNGATPEDIRPYVDAIPAQEPEKPSMMDEIVALIHDNMNSGAEGVKPSPKGNESPEEAKRQEFLNEISRVNNKEG